MKKLLSAFFTLCSVLLFAQTEVSGLVVDEKGIPVEGANVYLEGTFDGASTLADGTFKFETTETRPQTLVVSFLAFDTFTLSAEVASMKGLKILLKGALNVLTGVTITAGSFEAGSTNKASVLKPLDIVTTASALGDVVGALQTLPGTSPVAEDGRLFVRGGEPGETQIFIDGIRVFTPFVPTANNVPTRGRYSPFLFKGITFSTGGYSAEFGQALSGVLQLNTIDEPDQGKTDISAMTVGAGLGHTQIWGNHSLSINTSYINLAPYLAVYNDRNTWNKAPESAAGEAVFRYKKGNGILKLYAAFDYGNFDVEQQDIDFEEDVRFKLINRNFYLNSSYKTFFGDGWTLQTGGSYTFNGNDLSVITDEIDNTENSIHLKLRFKKTFSNKVSLNFGAEHFFTDFNEQFQSANNFKYGFKGNLSAAFVETDVFFSNSFALKAGLRAEYNTFSEESTLSPRLSMAYKPGEKGQFSVAYGSFYQNPLNDYLKFNSSLANERASHFITNYQYIHNGRTFRAEAYHKNYKNLVTFDTELPQGNTNFGNGGFGEASGLDIFYRDNKTIKNMDYWVSYSYLDTRRKYQNFPVEAAPQFVNRHTFSVVNKYWIDKLKSQVGTSYTFGSGRPYTNPNIGGFLSEKTKPYHNLSVNWAYLIDPQKILYFSVNNVLGRRNVFGYDYANTPNENGLFERQAVVPNADMFFFVGFFWTISTDKKSNQLNNL